jgi:hypothetical protein
VVIRAHEAQTPELVIVRGRALQHRTSGVDDALCAKTAWRVRDPVSDDRVRVLRVSPHRLGRYGLLFDALLMIFVNITLITRVIHCVLALVGFVFRSSVENPGLRSFF